MKINTLAGLSCWCPITIALILLNLPVPAMALSPLQIDDQRQVTGTVTDSNGEPLGGVNIIVSGKRQGTISGFDGSYILTAIAQDTLVYSFVGFKSRKERVGERLTIDVVLQEDVMALGEVTVNAGYYTVKERERTGSISRVTAEEISKQPVSNVLGALSGRVSGLEVTQSTGSPGSSFRLQIRGRNSITQGSEPLILIDGIPFAAQNENINALISSIGDNATGGGISPFFSINPANIESIEVLKDADATAIYGSRGANGVVLITTKKGGVGKTKVSVNFSQSFNHAPKGMKLMNTAQYLDMRKEAFDNRGMTPDVDNAPDLVQWDQDRYTDLRRELLGNTGYVTNAQLSVSGGNSETQFLLGGSYHRETNIFPGKFPSKRGNVNINLNHTSTDKKLQVNFSGSYTGASHQTIGSDLTVYTFLPPNIPSFFDEEGHLKWEEYGTNYENPYAYLLKKYRADTGNVMGSLNLSYKIGPSFTAKVTAGYNEQTNKDVKTFPKASYAPTTVIERSSQFGHTQFKGWSIEPQLEYKNVIGAGELHVLIGGTFQERENSGSILSLTGFSSDALLESAGAANAVTDKSTSYLQYRYQALFGRINYNIESKYLINITGRRDGSSRFGPGQQYANFGAIGAAWIFSSENNFKEKLPFISYGKLRGSYGITGNDQIGNYQYLEAWTSSTSRSYQNTSSLNPNNLYNPVYGWEKNKKLEGAIELGFFDDSILFTANYFRNRSSNQLVQYKLPATTGFTSIIRNFPALVENKGWEFLLNARLFKTGDFQWNSTFNLTLPENKLLEYPDIENSSYNYTYVEGKPLNVVYSYESLGVDPETGLFHFRDVNGDGIFSVEDYTVNGHTDPEYYGGFRNSFKFKGLSLTVFFDFRKQWGRNFLHSIYQSNGANQPGTMLNQPVALLERWQNEGDIRNYEKFSPSSISGRPGVLASNAVYSDQSFIRLRNIQLSYDLPPQLLSAIKSKHANIYVQGQNLVTWNRDKGYDPEVQNLYRLAPFKTYAIGIQLTF